jgi:hypothetical protein
MQINTKIKVAAAGEALIDLICNDPGLLQPCLGGAVYNLTRALARCISAPCRATDLDDNWRKGWPMTACTWAYLSQFNR